jgi:putative transposase
MPSKNLIKFYIADSVYHIYNRGVEKRIIFQDAQDYKVFLNYLKEYLTDPESTPKLQGPTLQLRMKNYFGEIELLAFCLMPNHFHMIIKQKDKNSIKKFTQSLFTRYSMYFNKKYSRVGSLFQSKYKATNAINEDYLLDLTKYIHLNPVKNLVNAYSSYSDYLGLTNTVWLNTKIVMNKFKDNHFIVHKKIKSYKDFVENFKNNNDFEDIDL